MNVDEGKEEDGGREKDRLELLGVLLYSNERIGVAVSGLAGGVGLEGEVERVDELDGLVLEEALVAIRVVVDPL